MFVKKFVGM